MVEIDVCKYEIRSVWDGEFEVVQFDDNLVQSVKIGVKLPLEVKNID